MTSIVDVAKLADVSTGTVSRVLNNDPAVRPRTRRLVLRAIAELGYVPNSAARGLRSSRTGTIGLVIPDLGSPLYHDATTGIVETVRAHGYSLILCDSANKTELEALNLRSLFERRVEGLILCPVAEQAEEAQLFFRAGTPVLVVGSDRAYPGVPNLSLNRRDGLKGAFEYLIGLGHGRIAFVNARLPGYVMAAEAQREVVQELGLAYDPSLVILAANAVECVATTAALLRRPDRPTAIVSGGHLAPHVLQASYEAGLAIPGDLSFISLAESPWAAVHRPPVTVVSFDNVHRGRVAAQYIFKRIAGEEADDLLQEVRSKITIRESCAPPAAD